MVKDVYDVQPKDPYFYEVSTSAEFDAYRKAGVSMQGMLNHLKFVQMRGVQGRLSELMFLQFLLKDAMVLEKLLIYCKQYGGTRFNELLQSVPRASSSVITVKVDGNFEY